MWSIIIIIIIIFFYEGSRVDWEPNQGPPTEKKRGGKEEEKDFSLSTPFCPQPLAFFFYHLSPECQLRAF